MGDREINPTRSSMHPGRSSFFAGSSSGVLFYAFMLQVPTLEVSHPAHASSKPFTTYLISLAEIPK